MANYKNVSYAIIPRGLVDNFYIRIHLDNGVYYDRYFSFNLDQKELMKEFYNILKSKQYSIQHLQSDNKRIQEIAEAITKSDSCNKTTVEDLHPININLFLDENNKLLIK